MFIYLIYSVSICFFIVIAVTTSDIKPLLVKTIKTYA